MENKNGRSCDLCLEREKDIETVFEEIMPEIFPYLKKETYI